MQKLKKGDRVICKIGINKNGLFKKDSKYKIKDIYIDSDYTRIQINDENHMENFFYLTEHYWYIWKYFYNEKSYRKEKLRKLYEEEPNTG